MWHTSLMKLNLIILLSVVCLLTFDVRMNSFSEFERNEVSRSSRLIDAAEISNSCLLPLDQGLPLWKLFETPVYKRLRVSQEYIERYLHSIITLNHAPLLPICSVNISYYLIKS